MKRSINEANIIVENDCRTIIDKIDLTPLKDKKILITGGNGLFGRYILSTIALANKEIDLNCSVLSLSLHKPPSDLMFLFEGNKRFSFLEVDLSKQFLLSDTYDYIFHAAGYAQPAKFTTDPLSIISINVDSTRNLLEINKKSNGTFLYFSSSAVYGEVPREVNPIPETYNGNCSTTRGRFVYAESKRMGEALCGLYSDKFKSRVKIARISHTYGPGISIEDSRVLGEFLREAFIENKITLLDEGKSVKTFGYISDMVKMLFHIVFYGVDMIYNVGGVDSMSILDLANIIGKMCNVSVKTSQKISKLEHIGQDPTLNRLDLSRILKEIGNFSFTPFDEGIRRTIDWSKNMSNIE